MSNEPLVSRQVLRDRARQADTLWEMAVRAFDPLPQRLRSLAEGANAQSRAINLAELAEVPWKGRDRGLVLPDGLTPAGDREGPGQLWAAFDRSVKELSEQMAVQGNNRGVYLAFEGLRDAAAAIADAIDPPTEISDTESEQISRTG